MKAWPALAIVFMQGILYLGHWFIASSWIAFWPGPAPAGLRATLIALSFSFVLTSLAAYRFSNLVVRSIYRLAAVWFGFFGLILCAVCLTWIVWFAMRLMGYPPNAAVRPVPALVLHAIALAAGIFGLVNARFFRVRHFAIDLPNLPSQWHGRRAALLSDLHLGPINGERFCRRIVELTGRYNPDIVFIPGDLFDGSHADLDHVLSPIRQLAPPLGIYYSTGNHEEFTPPAQYLEAASRAGIRVLSSEMITVDGVQIAGVSHHDSTSPLRMKTVLNSMHLDSTRPSILLSHEPTRLPLVERAGFNLQLSGHTHGGQVFPLTWLTGRVYGRFTRGLQFFGSLLVCVSTGAGTWGPPMRLGSISEIVLLDFE